MVTLLSKRRTAEQKQQKKAYSEARTENFASIHNRLRRGSKIPSVATGTRCGQKNRAYKLMRSHKKTNPTLKHEAHVKKYQCMWRLKKKNGRAHDRDTQSS